MAKKTKQHVKTVFEDPQKELNQLIEKSIALKSLPEAVRGELVVALKGLPEDKMIEAIQILQQGKSQYLEVAQKNGNAKETANQNLKKSQKTARKIIEDHERKVAEHAAKSALND